MLLEHKTVTEVVLMLIWHFVVEGKEKEMSEKLAAIQSVNPTLDIWSDRRMRAFFGVTAHYVENRMDELSSALLACKRFEGSHTGDRIAAELESILDLYDIKHKIDYVLTDNAANMKKAMTIALYSMENCAEGAASAYDEDAIDNPDIWQDVDDTNQSEILEMVNAHCRKERLSCFDHTLHVVVGDGLKHTKCVSSALAKCCKISSLVHTSSLFISTCTCTCTCDLGTCNISDEQHNRINRNVDYSYWVIPI